MARSALWTAILCAWIASDGVAHAANQCGPARHIRFVEDVGNADLNAIFSDAAQVATQVHAFRQSIKTGKCQLMKAASVDSWKQAVRTLKRGKELNDKAGKLAVAMKESLPSDFAVRDFLNDAQAIDKRVKSLGNIDVGPTYANAHVSNVQALMALMSQAVMLHFQLTTLQVKLDKIIATNVP